MPKDQDPVQPPPVDPPLDAPAQTTQPPAPAAVIASDDAAAPSEADKAVVLVLRSPNVAAFRYHVTQQVEMVDPDKDDGSTKLVDVEVPLDITPAGTEVSADVVDNIRKAALDAGLVVTEKG